MQHIQLNLTNRQGQLVLAALRLQLRELNDQIENYVLTDAELIELQSEANVIRSTMQVLKDELYKLFKQAA